jgi:hypothetical protein
LLPPGSNEYQDNAESNAGHNLGHLGDIHAHEKSNGKNTSAQAKSIHYHVGFNRLPLGKAPNHPSDENQK